jgi:hypothetical protein
MNNFTESLLIVAPDHTAELPVDPLTVLHSWADKGWLRRLDSALAAFMRELDSKASPVLLVSTAVLAQMEGRGHTCLSLRLLVTQPDEVLAWPATAQEDLNALWQMLPTSLAEWLDSLRASPLVRSRLQQIVVNPWYWGARQLNLCCICAVIGSMSVRWPQRSCTEWLRTRP